MNGNTDRVMEACSIQCMCEQDITPDTSPLRTDGAACHNQDEFEERGLSVTPGENYRSENAARASPLFASRFSSRCH